MNSTATDPETGATAATSKADLKLEAVVIPVADVDRSKKFYEDLGWRLDADFGFDNGFRVVQLTPPGSPASIQFGTLITGQQPGTAEGIYLVVSDIETAHDQLVGLGAEVSDVFHPESPGAQFGRLDGGQAAGPADDGASYGSFATFRDPDGNTFLLQQVTARIPGRVETSSTEYASVSDLVGALKRAAAAHGEHEARTGEEDANWPEWYAAYMVAENHGTELPV
ncbi:VOC family protein [Nocardioides sp. CER19]|uniref:VOC family protein n=1 Tax=Nocardioides sp. CER19 TaxID=3038538 RepID=UPI00244C40C5|nr:VOC family protein [Nocardioides sp. CER19]MDH2415974.1 VOC family protein [Nocardioides sp. CER19]